MQRQRLWLIMCLCGLAGCTLRDPLEVSVSCPDAEYYMNANGDILGHFDEPSDPFYSVYLETQFCPMAFPECYPREDGALCHESCRENEVFCIDHCIKPLEDKTYCGAKGLCNDGDVNSDDYRGKTCRKDQKCEEGQCVCARDTDIMCGDQCIDANNNDDFCGAKGLCNSSDGNSDDFKGHKCDKNQRCSDGQCVCARDSDILCDGKCTDPDNDMTYCGAKGLCTDSEMTSDNYKGITCDKSQRCSEGQCVCAREDDIECGGKCIDPDTDMTYCGAKGLCTDSELTSDNYKGITCDKSQRCNEGQCICAREDDIECGDKCIDPDTDMTYCGAKGLCTDSELTSDNYKGITCDKSQRCKEGQCVCAREDDIECGGKCIDPDTDMTYCGAKGLCTDSELTSDNYKGVTCDKSQRCYEGACTCGREGDIECGGKCIDPENSDKYCGAKGLCTDSELTSDNYKGVICDKTQRCSEGHCVCAREGDIECDGKCIDPLFDATHCGAKGLCNESVVGLNYKGVTCASGQICEDGVCRCVMSGYILCGDKCIDPVNNDLHCGASGLCTDSDYESTDFVGGNCLVAEDSNNRCVNRECICGENHHPYQNSCEAESDKNCGTHGTECLVSKFNHAASVACEHKECVVKTCQPGTFFAADGKSCITCQDLVSEVEVGDFISFGRYQQQKTSYGLVEDPIEWQVLAVDDDSVLVISRFILDAVKYNNTVTSVTWETCTLRAWLNGLGANADNSFMTEAFNEEELKCIQPVTNVNLSNQNYGTNGGKDTEDSVFLLSLCEAGHQPPSDKTQCPEDGPVYFESNDERKAYATDYAVEKGVSKPSGARYCTGVNNEQMCTSIFWLRSPGSYAFYAAYVSIDGSIGHGNSVNSSSIGVRPALWLKRANGE